jgi:elongation factor Ts
MATVEEIKQLRNMTGAGVNAVREALAASDGSTEKALEYLRKKGMAKADKRKDNETKNGVIGTYIHSNNQLVVLVEASVETDFAAKSPDVLKFAQDMALQIAAMGADYVTVDTIDPVRLSEEKQTFEKELEGKPDGVKEKILEGKLEKFYQDKVLMKQKLFTDENKSVEDYVNELVAKVGEKIEIKYFAKFQIGAAPVVVQR